MTSSLATMFALLQETAESAPAPQQASPVAMVIPLLVAVVMVASMWKIFTKAGQPGWAALVPIYNLITMLKIVGKPTWYIALLFVPLANFFVLITIALGMAKVFGKSTGFGVGLILLSPIFYPMLAFGDATYQGTAGNSLPGAAPVPA
jgi:hypothetical protein